MAIKKLNRDPNPSDLTQQDILINSKDGGLFYKTENNILNKIPGSIDPVINNSISVTKHFQLVNFVLDFKASGKSGYTKFAIPTKKEKLLEKLLGQESDE